MFLIGWSERPDNDPPQKISPSNFLSKKKVSQSREYTTMAKGKGKRQSGASETLADAGVSVSQPESAPEIQMPQLDEGAFAGLRQKIEQRLKDQSSGKGKKKNDKSNAPTQKTPATKEKQDTPKAGKKQEGSAQGKKRDRNGDVIARDEKKGGNPKQEKPGAGAKKSNSDDTLRQEILALGGTEEDLELLADVDSGSEVEGTSYKPKAKGGDDDLRKELSKMLEAAGHVVPEDLAEDEVEEEEEEEEEVEEEAEAEDDLEEETAQDEGSEGDSEETSETEDADSEDSDIEEAPAAPKEVKKKEPEVVVPKEFAKLVCDILLRPIRLSILTLLSLGRSPSFRLVCHSPVSSWQCKGNERASPSPNRPNPRARQFPSPGGK